MATGRRFATGDPLDHLVAGALDGERDAWDALVERLERVVWKSVNMMTSDRELRDDAFAATWLRLAERLDTIREPEKLPGWLATTACNEVRQAVRQRGRDHVTLDDASSPAGRVSGLLDTLTADEGEHARHLIEAERRRDVRRAFAGLDENCREIIAVLVVADPPVPYEEASDRLGRPVGSLGPARRRCLDKLRLLLDAAPGGDHG